MATSAYVGEKN